jgi:cytochrome c556
MSIKKISAMAIAGLLSIGIVSTFAQDAFVPPATPEEAVTMRQALMKQDGGILKGAADLTGDAAVAALQTIVTNYNHIPALFPEGSLVGDSEALPAIWENWDRFNAILETGKTAAAAGIAAAQAGDAAGYGAALKALGGSCGACHDSFRAES